jgi:hypothetical protein
MEYQHPSLTFLQLGAWLQSHVCRLWVEGIAWYRYNILQDLANISFSRHLLQIDPQSSLQPSQVQQPAPTLQWLGLDRSQLSPFSHAPGHQRGLDKKEQAKLAAETAPPRQPVTPLCATLKKTA